MNIYDYRRLTDPSEAELNALGAQGYRIVASYLDPKQTFSQVVIMEKLQELENTATYQRASDEFAVSIEHAKKGRR